MQLARATCCELVMSFSPGFCFEQSEFSSFVLEPEFGLKQVSPLVGTRSAPSRIQRREKSCKSIADLLASRALRSANQRKGADSQKKQDESRGLRNCDHHAAGILFGDKG